MELRAAVIVNDASQARPILESLSRKGFAGIVESDSDRQSLRPAR